MSTKKYTGIRFALLTVAGFGLLPLAHQAREDPPGSASSGSVTVTLRPQKTNMWCWAASGQMVMEFFGKDVEQCKQANNRFGSSNCCDSPTPTPCVQGGWPEFQKYGFSFQMTTDAPLTWDQVVNQIGAKKKPFAFSWHWNQGGGHMMVLVAYSQSGGSRYVTINNPWPPNIGEVQVLTYDAYVSGPNYTHWNDYYDVTRVASGEDNANGKKKPATAGSEAGDKRKEGASTGESAVKKERTAALKQSRGTAENALKKLDKVDAVKNLFAPGAADKAALAEHAFPVVTVGLADLKNQEPGGDPKKLLNKSYHTVIHPILSGENVVASMTVQHKDDAWVVASYNGGTLARLLDQARSSYAKKNKADPATSYVVSIPALNLYFVAFPTDDALQLVPILDEPSFGLKKEQAVKASDILPKLIEAAKKHNGLPS